MNKITDIIINKENSTMQLVVMFDSPTTLSEVQVYVDEYDNIDNIYEEGSDKHTYYFATGKDPIDIIKLTDTNYIINIEDLFFSGMNNNLKYVRINSGSNVADGIYYTPEDIYNAELTHIKKVCSTCLDDKCMQLIVYVTFKRQLLESAIQLNKHKEAMNLYMDIHRLLDIQSAKCTNTKECASCANGYCSIK